MKSTRHPVEIFLFIKNVLDTSFCCPVVKQLIGSHKVKTYIEMFNVETEIQVSCLNPKKKHLNKISHECFIIILNI